LIAGWGTPRGRTDKRGEFLDKDTGENPWKNRPEVLPTEFQRGTKPNSGGETAPVFGDPGGRKWGGGGATVGRAGLVHTKNKRRGGQRPSKGRFPSVKKISEGLKREGLHS